jgi:hypothetical protein
LNGKSKERKVLPETHPHLLAEWDFEKNEVRPGEVTAGSHKKVWWICSKNPEHGWEASPNNRTSPANKNGCPFCKTIISKGHQEVIDFTKSIYFEKILINDRKTILNSETGKFLELDIFLPNINLGIEYNGDYFHSFDRMKLRDNIKKQICEEKGIKLLSIQENDWKNNQEQTREQIRLFIEKCC